MDMQLSEGPPGSVIVALRGRLDTAGVGEIETRFYASFLPRGLNALVDLAAIDFVASMGIRMLVTAAKSLDAKGRRLILFGATDLVEEVLRDTGIDQFIPLVADRAAALDRIQSP